MSARIRLAIEFSQICLVSTKDKTFQYFQISTQPLHRSVLLHLELSLCIGMKNTQLPGDNGPMFTSANALSRRAGNGDHLKGSTCIAMGYSILSGDNVTGLTIEHSLLCWAFDCKHGQPLQGVFIGNIERASNPIARFAFENPLPGWSIDRCHHLLSPQTFICLRQFSYRSAAALTLRYSFGSHTHRHAIHFWIGLQKHFSSRLH